MSQIRRRNPSAWRAPRRRGAIGLRPDKRQEVEPEPELDEWRTEGRAGPDRDEEEEVEHEDG